MSFYNFGLEPYFSHVLYGAGILAILLSLLWRPIVGIAYLIPLIPLQTVRYRVNDFPLGNSLIWVVLVGVTVGIIRQRRSFLPRTPWTRLLCVFALFTFASMCLGSLYLNVPLPLSPSDPRLADWSNYMAMFALLFLVAATVDNKRQVRLVVFLMCFSVLALDYSYWTSVRFRSWESLEEVRGGGSMGFVGANGLGAFLATFATLLLALSCFERRRILRLTYYALTVFCGVCMVYTLSRGAYIAFLSGWVFIGLTKRRSLVLLLGMFLIGWQGVVPDAVKNRVTASYDKETNTLEHSAELRIELWEDALQIVRSNPLLGTGYNTYAYMGRVRSYADTHNYFLKVMAETGVVGTVLFLLLITKTFGEGYRLFRTATDPFLASLGLGLAGWVVGSLVASLFGDRWSYFQINGYLWVLAGVVARAPRFVENNTPAPGKGEQLLSNSSHVSVATAA